MLQYQGALFFGVDALLLKCKIWLSELDSSKGPLSLQIQLDDLIHIWNFGEENGEDFIWFLQPLLDMIKLAIMLILALCKLIE